MIFALAIFPLLTPLNLPLGISYTTQKYYETVQTLKAGDIVIFHWGEGTAQWGEMGPPGIAQMQQLCNIPGVRIIVFSTTAEAPGLFESNLLPAIDLKGRVYGRDWVNLGYYPGGETAIAALATDPHKLITADYWGHPISELPLMNDFKSGADIALIVGNEPSSGESYLRQFQTKFKTKIVWCSPSAVYTTSLAYFASGQLSGLLNSLRGGAELEKLIGKPGRGMSAMDAMSCLHLWVIVLIVLGNISYFQSKRR
jgi:hypothetical protein